MDPSTMRRLSFRFNVDKLIQTLTFLASRGVADLTKLRAAKLLFFADKYHLRKFGRPIVGDAYYCLDKGPIPSASLTVINDLISPTVVEGVSDPILDRVREYLTVKRQWFGRHPELTAKRAPNLELLSESEIEALEDTIQRYGSLPVGELIEAAHREPAWQIPNQDRTEGGRAEMPYELFFVDATDEEKRVCEIMEAEQEDRDFADAFGR
jgi:uncharacterized phage-associated protein